MKNSIKNNIQAFRENEENRDLSLQEINKKLLFKFEKMITEDGNRMLVMPADIAGIRGKVALYVRTDGTVRKAVLADDEIMQTLKIKESEEYISAEGEKYFLYEQLGTVANSSGYRAVKLPYSEAVWQPLKHVLVAYAYDLIKSVYDDYVVNHIASRYQGDGLGNLEVVTQSENTACGKFVNKLMNEFSFITYISLSAKKANVLKYFWSSIRELISRIEERPTTIGKEFILDDIRYEFTPESIRINCRLKHGTEYDNHMMIVMDRGDLK